MRDVGRLLGVSPTAVHNFVTGSTPQEDTLKRIEAWAEREGVTVRGGTDTEDVDTAVLNLPDPSFLHAPGRAFFSETILEWIRRGWTSENIEAAAAHLLGYFTRASTLQSSGVSQPELSPEMELSVLEQSKEEIEHVYRKRGGGSKR